MDVTEFSARNFFPFRFEICHLAGNEPAAAGRDRDLAKHFRHGIAARRFGAGRNFERDGKQRVARKDGNAVTENFVAGRAAAPEIVVVHARQIVVN